MRSNHHIDILIVLVALMACAGVAAEEVEPGTPSFYPDYESAFLAFEEAKGGLAIPVEVNNVRTPSTIGAIDLNPAGLRIQHESGSAFVELRKVRRVRDMPPIYPGAYHRLYVDYFDDRPSIEIWARNENIALHASNALSTLVASAGGRLFEAAGFSTYDSATREKQKKAFGWAKKDLAYGIVIAEPPSGTPAARAGFKAGDVLLTIKDVPVWEGIEIGKDDAGNLIIADPSVIPTGDVSRNHIRLTDAGGMSQLGEALLRCLLSDATGRVAVKIEAVSGTASKWTKLTRELVLRDLAKLYRGPRLPRFTLGMFALPLGDEDRGRLGLAGVEGLLITEVNKDGLAERLKLRVDDVLVELNGRPVRTTEELAGAMADFNKVESVKVYRTGAPVTLTMPKRF